MYFIDIAQVYKAAHSVESEICSPLDAFIDESCSGGCADLPKFFRRSPTSIEKALYSHKPRLTFEVHFTQGEARQGSQWLTY
ncbi:MAG: hypothetical protein IKZ82_07825 [Clostridia bacterium]|nr:hypothetical protein [Clostridia bacterium]